MNSHTGKHSCSQDNNLAGQASFSAQKHTESPIKGRDIVDQPFPNKPVCHKRLVNPTSHVQDSIQINSDSSRLPARERHMARVIHKKQLILLKKLWKVEDVLRQKIPQDNGGVKGSQNTMEDSCYGYLEENGKSDAQPRHKTEVTGSETVYQERDQNSKQHKSRHDITNKHKEEIKMDKKPTENAVARQKEESRKTHIYDEKTIPKGKQKTRLRLTRDQEKVLPEKLILPQVSSQTLKLTPGNNGDNVQCLPCKICNRVFNNDRLEKHVQICEKVKKSKRPVFNSSLQRTG